MEPLLVEDLFDEDDAPPNGRADFPQVHVVPAQGRKIGLGEAGPKRRRDQAAPKAVAPAMVGRLQHIQAGAIGQDQGAAVMRADSVKHTQIALAGEGAMPMATQLRAKTRSTSRSKQAWLV